MKISKTNIEGCFLIEPAVYTDTRGFFMETYNKRNYEELFGSDMEFIQDNQSVSHKHVLRGLHYQKGKYAQAKLGRVVKGAALDVVVDIRKGSPSFGEIFATELSEYNKLAIFIPKGLAHGFLALEDHTIFSYKCDAYYNPSTEAGIIYNDPDLAIDWGIPESELILSEKDKALPAFKEVCP